MKTQTRYIVRGGASPRGPFSEGQLRDLWHSGVIARDAECWAEGFKAWLPISQVLGKFKPQATAPREVVVESLASQGRRWAALLLDVIFAVWVVLPLLSLAFHAMRGTNIVLSSEAQLLVNLSALLIYLAIRDCVLGNRGIAKRILGLRILDASTHQPCTAKQALLRNAIPAALLGCVLPMGYVLQLLFGVRSRVAMTLTMVTFVSVVRFIYGNSLFKPLLRTGADRIVNTYVADV